MRIIILGVTVSEANEKFEQLFSCYPTQYIKYKTNSRIGRVAKLTDGTLIMCLATSDNCRGHRANYLYISKNIPYEEARKYRICLRDSYKEFYYEYF